jgi:hypothetical protein
MKGCNDHFVITPHERKTEGVDTIKGVREYLWPETDILFVQENLPYDGVATPLFGPAARKIWQTFYEVGLVTRLFKDPLAAEAAVFGSGLFIAYNLRLSIMTLNWRAEPIKKDGWEVIIADWRRVDTVCEKLKAKKIAYLGKKLSNKGGRDWMKDGARLSNSFGYLREHLAGNHPVQLYGLPLTKLGPETNHFFAELKYKDIKKQ